MSTAEIILELKTRRTAALEASAKFQAEADQMTAAIDALEGKDSGPSVIEMLEAACQAIVRPHLPKQVAFDYPTVKAEAQKMFKEQWPRIKAAFYTSMTALAKKGVIRKTQGGFELTPR